MKKEKEKWVGVCLHLVAFLGIAAVAHRLQIFDTVAAALAAGHYMVYSHQLEILGVHIYMETASKVLGFYKVSALLAASGLCTVQAMGGKYP